MHTGTKPAATVRLSQLQDAYRGDARQEKSNKFLRVNITHLFTSYLTKSKFRDVVVVLRLGVRVKHYFDGPPETTHLKPRC
jgi:hypothetical protein